MFSDPFLRETLAFRGGTAIHKIFLKPPVRYSEDIDLVQIKKNPIKPILEKIRTQLSFLGTKRSIKQNERNNTIKYRFESEILPVINLHLKIEINCREHFNVLGYKEVEHEIKNSWFDGSCSIISFELEELFGTKLRALYQRRKGRDLFDLYHALTNLDVNTKKLVDCYNEYMNFSVNHPPTQKQFLQNMKLKMKDPDFEGDIYGLLRPGVNYNKLEAYKLIKKEVIEKI